MTGWLKNLSCIEKFKASILRSRLCRHKRIGQKKDSDESIRGFPREIRSNIKAPKIHECSFP